LLERSLIKEKNDVVDGKKSRFFPYLGVKTKYFFISFTRNVLFSGTTTNGTFRQVLKFCSSCVDLNFKAYLKALILNSLFSKGHNPVRAMAELPVSSNCFSG